MADILQTVYSNASLEKMFIIFINFISNGPIENKSASI